MRRFLLLFACLCLLPPAARAEVSPDAAMAQVAEGSPLFRQARQSVIKAVDGLKNAQARQSTRAALLSPDDCVRHRIGVDLDAEREIVATLAKRGFLEGQYETGTGLETTRAMLFPPLVDEGGACPHLANPVLAAAGGNSGSHHSWPGGLAEHIATNLASGMALSAPIDRKGRG